MTSAESAKRVEKVKVLSTTAADNIFILIYLFIYLFIIIFFFFWGGGGGGGGAFFGQNKAWHFRQIGR